MPDTPRRAITPAAALLTTAALAGVLLHRVQPHLHGNASSWTGDELAFAATWLVAAACTAWLALTTLAWAIALARGELDTAARIAACAPPVARRLLQSALVSAVVLSPATAYAAAPPAPFTLHVGASGRVTAPPAPSAPRDDVPVVRAPVPTTTTTTTTTVPTTSTTTSSPTRAPTVPVIAPTTTSEPPAPHPRPAPSTRAIPAAPVFASRTYVVRAGDNLWGIAAREVTLRQHAPATDTQIANYWLRLEAANRTTLRSGDPSLIFPNEIVTLPLD